MVSTVKTKGKKGKPCGESYISADKECGQNSSPSKTEKSSKKPIDRKKIAERNLRNTAISIVFYAAILGLAEMNRRKIEAEDRAAAEEYRKRVQEEFKRAQEDFDRTYEYFKTKFNQQQESDKNYYENFYNNYRSKREQESNSTPWWEVLNVKKDASSADIKKAYRDMSKKFHPDVNKDPEAEEKMKEINAAFEFSNARNRKDSTEDPKQIKVKAIQVKLKQMIEAIYTGGIDRLLSAAVGSSGSIIGKFSDQQQIYDFTLSESGELSYVEGKLTTDSLEEWGRSVRFDQTNTVVQTKKRECVNSKPCKNSCISRGLKCSEQLPDELKGQVSGVKQALQSLQGTSSATPQTKPEAKSEPEAQSQEPAKNTTQPTPKERQNRLAQLGLLVGGYLAINAVDRKYQISDKAVSGAARVAFAGINLASLDKAINVLPINDEAKKNAQGLLGASKVALVRSINELEDAELLSVDAKTNAYTYKLKDGSFQSVTSVGGKVMMFTTNNRGSLDENGVYSMKFTVDNTFDANANNREEGIKLARNASAIFKQHIDLVPDGSHLVCWAHKADGKGEKRKNIYEKAGFSEVEGEDGALWAYKEKGKIVSPSGEEAVSYFDQWNPNFNQPIFWERINELAGEQVDNVVEAAESVKKRKTTRDSALSITEARIAIRDCIDSIYTNKIERLLAVKVDSDSIVGKFSDGNQVYDFSIGKAGELQYVESSIRSDAYLMGWVVDTGMLKEGRVSLKHRPTYGKSYLGRLVPKGVKCDAILEPRLKHQLPLIRASLEFANMPKMNVI